MLFDPLIDCWLNELPNGRMVQSNKNSRKISIPTFTNSVFCNRNLEPMLYNFLFILFTQFCVINTFRVCNYGHSGLNCQHITVAIDIWQCSLRIFFHSVIKELVNYICNWFYNTGTCMNFPESSSLYIRGLPVSPWHAPWVPSLTPAHNKLSWDLCYKHIIHGHMSIQYLFLCYKPRVSGQMSVLKVKCPYLQTFGCIEKWNNTQCWQ